MKRRLFNFVAAISLVLCVATCVLWMRSYRGLPKGFHDSLVGHSAQTTFIAESVRGKIKILICPNRDLGNASWIGSWTLAGLGFRLHVLKLTDYVSRDIDIPHWSLTLLFVILPTVVICRRRRRGQDVCRRCGYDLRASGDRCPECGTIVPAAR